MNNFNNKKEELKKSASDMYNEGKEKASSAYNEAKSKSESMAHQFSEGVSDLYEQGKEKVNDLQGCMNDYSDDLINNIKDKPLTSVLIAAGVGFLMSRLLKK